jgi:hypothetical protein
MKSVFDYYDNVIEKNSLAYFGISYRSLILRLAIAKFLYRKGVKNEEHSASKT